MPSATAVLNPAAMAAALARRCIRSLKRSVRTELQDGTECLCGKVCIGKTMPVPTIDAAVRALDRLGILTRVRHGLQRCHLVVELPLVDGAQPVSKLVGELLDQRLDLRRGEPSEQLAVLIDRSFSSLYHLGWSYHRLGSPLASDRGFQEAIREAEKLGRNRKNKLLVKALSDHANCCRARGDGYQARLVERRLARLS